MTRQLAPLDHPRVREQPAPARHRPHRPVPDPPARPGRATSTRRSARSPTSCTQGKVRYLGSSTFPASEIVEAQWTAERRNRERFVCEQPPYSILVRGIEADVLPTCDRYGMGVIPWSPLAGGWLSGKWRKGADPTSRRADARPRPLRPRAAREPAQARGGRRARPASPTRRASRSCTSRSRGCSTIPTVTAAIIGPRTMEQLTTPARRRRRHARRRDARPRSTRSSRPARTSAGPTRATRRPASRTRSRRRRPRP